MGFFQFKRTKRIDASHQEVWKFISNPQNLGKITPPQMGFLITSDLPAEMYAGMIISYKVKPLLGIPVTWVTEITSVEKGRYFVDEQRIGPYSMWHHQHIIEPSSNGNGVIMHDIVSYKPPFGFIGSMINHLVIDRKLNEIFNYREIAINKFFENN
ncbi:MAG: SRPBCC family protein [Bacteroidales bacterium]|nr:SRPBCC family protein [Bacteroidales bacterium]